MLNKLKLNYYKKSFVTLTATIVVLTLTSFVSVENTPDRRLFGSETITGECQGIGNSGHGIRVVTTNHYFLGIKVSSETSYVSCAATTVLTESLQP